MWTKDKIIGYLYYPRDYWIFHAGQNLRETLQALRTPSRRNSFRAPYENICLDNAWFDACWEKLTAPEQYILIELYGQNSGLDIDKNWWSEDAINKIKKETGLSLLGIKTKETCAMKALLNFLNGRK